MRRIRVRAIVVCFVGIFGFYEPVFGVQDGLYQFRSGVYVSEDRPPTEQQLKTLIGRITLLDRA